MYIRSLNVLVSANVVVAAWLCVACIHDAPTVRTLPTARIMPQAIAQRTVATVHTVSDNRAAPPLQTTMAPPLAPSATTLPTLVVPTPEQASLPPLDQYRRWIAEAHLQYPFPESEDTMWAVMLCESSGNPDSVGGIYYGLFQYSATTWSGDWNPYRDQPIFDPRAQIYATAKAWHDGNQHWWGCYPS